MQSIDSEFLALYLNRRQNIHLLESSRISCKPTLDHLALAGEETRSVVYDEWRSIFDLLSNFSPHHRKIRRLLNKRKKVMSEQISDEKTLGLVNETKKTNRKRARSEIEADKTGCETEEVKKDHASAASSADTSLKRTAKQANSARGLSHLDSPTRRRVIERRRQRNDYSDMASVRVFSPSDVEEDKSSSSWVRRGDGEAFDILAERPMSEWRRAQMSTALRLAVSRLRVLSPKRTSPRKASSPKM